jgi:hypothetical protein
MTGKIACCFHLINRRWGRRLRGYGRFTCNRISRCQPVLQHLNMDCHAPCAQRKSSWASFIHCLSAVQSAVSLTCREHCIMIFSQILRMFSSLSHCFYYFSLLTRAFFVYVSFDLVCLVYLMNFFASVIVVVYYSTTIFTLCFFFPSNIRFVFPWPIFPFFQYLAIKRIENCHK